MAFKVQIEFEFPTKGGAADCASAFSVMHLGGYDAQEVAEFITAAKESRRWSVGVVPVEEVEQPALVLIAHIKGESGARFQNKLYRYGAAFRWFAVDPHSKAESWDGFEHESIDSAKTTLYCDLFSAEPQLKITSYEEVQ